MEYLLYSLIFVVAVLVVLFIYETFFHKKEIIRGRLSEVKSLSGLEVGNEFKESFQDRVLKPAYQGLIKKIGNLAPARVKEKYKNLIITSGESKGVTFNSVLMSQILMSAVLGGFVYIALKYTASQIDLKVIIGAAILGFALPVLLLHSNSQKRKDKVKRGLPDFLDLLYISVEAGLGFDLALKKSAEKMEGVLSEEVDKTLTEISHGRAREEAFRGLEKRTGVDEVGSFVVAIIQTEQLGSNIANMLKIQSNTMRMKRRQNAEEKAAKMGIKMLFPLIFFIFPSLFVVILGPALINIFENFLNAGW